jgi:hypothetical protein
MYGSSVAAISAVVVSKSNIPIPRIAYLRVILLRMKYRPFKKADMKDLSSLAG